MNQNTSSAKSRRRPMPHENKMTASSNNDPVVGGALPSAMSRTEIAAHGETSAAYAAACDTSVKLANLRNRIEAIHTGLYGDRISGASVGGNSISYTGFFGLLNEEAVKHRSILEEIDDTLTSIEHRTGLTQVDRTPFQIVEMVPNSTMARPERDR